MWSNSALATPPVRDPCQEDPACVQRSDAGIQFYEAQKYSEALAEFKAAYATRHAPRILINIGRSLFRLGREEESIIYYRQFIEERPDAEPEERKTVETYITEAQAALWVKHDQARKSQSEPSIDDRSVRPSERLPIPAIALMGSGLGLLIAGIACGVMAMNDAQIISNPANHNGVFNVELQQIQERGKTLATTAVTLDAVGGTALLASVVWISAWVIKHKVSRKTSITSSINGIGVRGIF